MPLAGDTYLLTAARPMCWGALLGVVQTIAWPLIGGFRLKARVEDDEYWESLLRASRA